MVKDKNPDTTPSITELVELARAAAVEAANFQERFAAEDTEARKIVDVMERFLRSKSRVVYGGAAINAHMPADKKFYDPTLNLPDYDFMTSDPLQDCADLITTFQHEGFMDVEAKFGIHEGTYKVFVNYRSAADITFMPPPIYRRIITDAKKIDGILYASVNFLRMNMYLELSRPAGMVSRWEKVYKRLLLLNEVHPLRTGHCGSKPLLRLSRRRGSKGKEHHGDRIVGIGIERGAVFLSGAHLLVEGEPTEGGNEIIMMMSDKPGTLSESIATALGGTITYYPAIGELLPARREIFIGKGVGGRKLVAVVFETVACHSYTILPHPIGYRLGSVDLLIQMYYALYFAGLDGDYLSVRVLCVIQSLIEIESIKRMDAAVAAKAAKDGDTIDLQEAFPLKCLGHQPSMPELKKAHRERVAEKREALMKALKIHNSFVGRKKSK
jgi:hypothetical protein